MGQKFSLLKCTYGKYVIPQHSLIVTIMTLVCILMYVAKFLGDELFVEAVRSYTAINVTRRGRTCEEAIKLNSTLIRSTGKFHRSITIMSASFMLCTTVGQFPSGICADLYGARHLLLFGFMGKIIIAIITPSVILYATESLKIIMRGVSGFFEGFITAATFNIVAHWALPRYLTLASTLLFNSNIVGYMIATLLKTASGINLQILLYVIGLMEGLLYMACIYYVFSRPSTHPSISSQEKAQYKELFPTDELPGSIPWKAILTDFNIWALFAVNVGYNFQYFIMQLRMRSYFLYVLHEDHNRVDFRFNVSSKIGITVFGITLAIIADYIIKKDYIPTVYVRSMYIGISLILSNIFTVLIVLVGCNLTIATTLLRLSFWFGSALDASIRANALDNSRHFAGTVCSITCGGGQLIRALLFFVFSYVLEHHSYPEWKTTVWLNLAICTFCTVMHFDGSRGERAPWDVIKPKEDKNRIRTTNVLL